MTVQIAEWGPALAAVQLVRRGGRARRGARGASIAVDDAGAGYASLDHDIHIRPDFVKLDRARVMDVDRDPAKHALVGAVRANLRTL